MTTAMRVRELKKSYGGRAQVPALRGASFDVPAGAVTAMVGPNGAGKTTCFNVLLEFLRPDSGTIEVRSGSHLSRRLAYLADRTVLDPFGSVRSVMASHEKIVVAADPLATANSTALIEGLGLEPLLKKRPSQLSRGEAQRVAICLALLGDPAIAILDEPFSGLDIVMRDRFRSELRSRCERGRVTMLSTHSVPDVEAVADWLVVLHQGVIRYSGPVRDLTDRQAFVGTLRGSVKAVRSVIAGSLPWLMPLTEAENAEIRIAVPSSQWPEAIRRAPEGASFIEAESARASLEATVLFLSGGQ